MSALPLKSSATAAYFEAMFATTDDPWGFRTRWYEVRKRALTLACLPQRRFHNGFEPGCANGELSAGLAERCDSLLVSDGNETALASARHRLATFPHVRLQQGWAPADWPGGCFDLIVISELGYFLGVDALTSLAAKALTSLDDGGTLLACHWRRPIEGFALDGDAVHQLLHEQLALPRLSTVVEPDLRIDVWCRDARSVGEREGLR